MRVAAILGLGCAPDLLHPFAHISDAVWQLGLPTGPNRADAVLVLGGDGTVHRNLAQLVALKLPVLVVPHGSGNDFAHALGLQNIAGALAAWRDFLASMHSDQVNVRKIDLGVISPVASLTNPLSGEGEKPGSYFCCVGGVGLDVEVARFANRLPRALRRRGGYLLSLVPALIKFRAMHVCVQTPQPGRIGGLATRHQGPVMVVAFANTPTYGGGIMIAPRAAIDDGKLEICLVSSMAKLRLLRLFPSVYRGNHLKLREVNYFPAERLRIETEIPVDVYADGEYVCQTPIDVTVKSEALTVIVPTGPRTQCTKQQNLTPVDEKKNLTSS
jgi:diacylglycerol kinase (ATP)